MSYSISTLLTRNLQHVFGENDPARRRAINEIFTEDYVFYNPNGGRLSWPRRGIAPGQPRWTLVGTHGAVSPRNTTPELHLYLESLCVILDDVGVLRGPAESSFESSRGVRPDLALMALRPVGQFRRLDAEFMFEAFDVGVVTDTIEPLEHQG